MKDSANSMASLATHAVRRRAILSEAVSVGSRTVLQPVVSLKDAAVFGYEALTRPSSPGLLPDVVLDQARKFGVAVDIDLAWFERSILDAGPRLGPGTLLFLNVLPATILSGRLTAAGCAALAAQSGLPPERIVLEITEEDAITDFHLMRRRLSAFHEAGFDVAIDDAGAGPSSFRSVVELRPRYIKLDRWLTHDLARDSSRHSMVRAIVDFAHRTRARVVAEGIEEVTDLEIFLELGVDLLQGFLLGPPAEIPTVPPSSVLDLIRNTRKWLRESGAEASWQLSDLVAEIAEIDAWATCEEALRLFQVDPLLEAIAVRDGGAVVGILTRARMMERFAGPYGLALLGRHEVRGIADRPLVVSARQTIREGAWQALDRAPVHRQQPLLVVDGERLLGAVGVMDLIQHMLTDEVAEARTVNPLTGLPGNVRIRAYLNAALEEKGDHVLFYADIDSFKSFNDTCGFAAGDGAIARLGAILAQVPRVCAMPAFTGHVGGDDFLFVIREADVAEVLTFLRTTLAGRWFDPEGRLPVTHLGVSIAGLPLATLQGHAYEERMATVARAKTRLKAEGGNRVVVFDELRSLEVRDNAA